MKPQSSRARAICLRRFAFIVLLANLVILLSFFWPASKQLLARYGIRSQGLGELDCPPRHLVEKRTERVAWVTSAYGNDTNYQRQILVLIKSLQVHGVKEEIFVIDDGSLSADFKSKVKRVGASMLHVDPLPVPEKVADSLDEIRHLPNFIRLRLWNVTEFDRLIFVDGDMLAVRDVDKIRRLPCPSAAPQKRISINAGLFVLCPCQKMAKDMLDKLQSADSRYPQAEQTFVSRFFRGKWHFVSTCFNARAYDYHPSFRWFLHWHFYFWPPRDICRLENLVLLHFSSGKKPWSPDAQNYYAKEILDLYDKGLQLVADL